MIPAQIAMLYVLTAANLSVSCSC